MESIAAGESYSGECPSNQGAQLAVGRLLPSKEKPLVKVLRVEGSKYELGPMKAGQILVNIPCENTLQEISFFVEEMPPYAAMNRYRPIGTDTVAYPSSLYLVILLLIAVPVLMSFFVVMLRRKKRIEREPDAKRKLSSRELLERELQFFDQNVTQPEAHHFHKLYKRIRAFLEKELSLKTKSLTTQEFLGTFRALALQQSTNQSLIAQLEYLLRTSDDVRFAGKKITFELWKDYLQRVRVILSAFPKQTSPSPKEPSRP